jgi:hypothetical protein
MQREMPYPFAIFIVLTDLFVDMTGNIWSCFPTNLLLELKVRLYLAQNKLESLSSVLVCIFPLIIGLCTVLLQAPCLSTAFGLLDSLKNLQLPFIKTHLWISQTGSA